MKVVIDDYALYRHQRLSTMIELDQMNTFERIASNNELKYRSLNIDGNIGLISNSAGLAMATCDLI